MNESLPIPSLDALTKEEQTRVLSISPERMDAMLGDRRNRIAHSLGIYDPFIVPDTQSDSIESA